jgi:hypothetical protein
MEDQAMQSILKLQPENGSAKATAPTAPKPEEKDPQPVVMGKRLHQMVNRAAHKAALQYGRQSSGLFSK